MNNFEKKGDVDYKTFEDQKIVEQKSRGHNWMNIGLIILLSFTYLLMIGFNALAGSGAGVPSIFISTVGNISDQFELYITPNGTTFSIWGLIFFWLAASMLFFIATIFLQTSEGKVYLSPEIANPSFLITLSLNFILNTAWIFIWDRASVNVPLTILAAIVLFLVAITNILAGSFLAYNIGRHCDKFSRGGGMFWYGLGYRLTLNGLGMYTTWCVVASLINLTTALVYQGEVDQRSACLASLSLLVIIHVSWFIVENFLVDFYARYLLTPYLVIIWASNGIRAKKYGDDEVPQDVQNYVLAILIIATITFVVRIVLVVYRVIKKPLTRINTVSTFNDQ